MKLPNKLDVEKIAEYINKHDSNTKVYIGCDSERLLVDKVWVVDYALVVIVHKEGKHGAKIFGAISRERDFDRKASKPSIRLMTEVYKTAELYLDLAKEVSHDIEVHLDINPEESCGSSCVISQAIGYIRGVCNVTPKVKPYGFAASNAADQLKRIMGSK